MPVRSVIAVGASAGGVEALVGLARGLPAELEAAVFVVLHLPPTARSSLPRILSRAGPLPAIHPADGDPIRPGQIYVAPPNCHLVLEPGTVRLDDGPRENRVRPAADVLFRSAARVYGSAAIGVVLSGTDGDGTLGLEAIHLRGGVTIAQDPDEATFPSMPSSAIERARVDHVVTIAQLPRLLAQLVGQRRGRGGSATMASPEPPMKDHGDGERLPLADEKQDGQASGLTCPDCHGSIWQLAEGQLVRFECRVGHSYNADAFLDAQAARVEDALWTAFNLLQERVATLRQFAGRFAQHSTLATAYEARAQDADEQAASVRGLLSSLLRSKDPESSDSQ